MPYPILQKNALALQHCGHVPGAGGLSQELYDRMSVEKAVQDGHFLRIKAKEGENSGPERILGSRISEEAYLRRQKIQDLTVEQNSLYYAFGMDSGRYIRELLKRMPQSSRLVCVEPCPEIFFRFAAELELSDILTDQRFKLVLVKDLKELEASLPSILPNLSSYAKIRHLKRDGGFFMDGFDLGEWTLKADAVIKYCLQMEGGGMGVFQNNSMNFYRNSLIALRNHDWDTVLERLRDKPLVIAGVGPMLYPEMENLRRLQKHCHIGCVDNALREFLMNGIEPDFVFQVTWKDRSLKFYHDLAIPPKTILVFSMLANSEVIRLWPGQRLSNPHGFEKTLVGDFLNSRLHPPYGNNVGHFAIQFAVQSGADPVFFVGLDNCYPMMMLYHPGAMDFGEIYPSVGRFWSSEKSEFVRNINHDMTVEIETCDGRKVWTDKSWASIKNTTAAYIASYKGKRSFFYCSKHIDPIPGTEYRGLDAEPEELFGRIFDKEPILLRSHTLDNRKLSETCERKLSDIKKYFTHLEAAEGMAKDLLLAVGDPEKADSLDFFEKEFQKHMGRFFGLGNNWLERAVMELEPGLGKWMEAEKRMLRDDMEDKEKRRKRGSEFIITYHERSQGVKKLLQQFFQTLRERISEM